MGSANCVHLLGHLGHDPELRSTAGGLPVANFSVATNSFRKGADGKTEKLTDWHRIVAFGQLADVARNYLTKGRQVYVEGRIQTRNWDDKQGQRRSTTEVVANRIQLLGSREPGRADSAGHADSDDSANRWPVPAAAEDADVPF